MTERRGVVVALVLLGGCTAFSEAPSDTPQTPTPDPGAELVPGPGSDPVRSDAACPNAKQVLCGDLCVEPNLPAYGCAPGVCSPCPSAHGFATCREGACVLAGCDTGYRDCDGDPSNGCETPLVGPVVCAECTNGKVDCDHSGACDVDTLGDARHCGKCGHACGTGEICSRGACHPSLCAAGERTTILRVTDETARSSAEFVVSPPTAKSFDALNEPGAGDGDDSYLERVETGSQARIRLAHEALELPAGAAITRVTLRARWRRTEASQPTDSGLALGMYFADRAEAGINGIWNTKVLQHSEPATSYEILDLGLVEYPWDPVRPWKVADVNTLELHVIPTPKSTTNAVRVTQAWLEVCSSK